MPWCSSYWEEYLNLCTTRERLSTASSWFILYITLYLVRLYLNNLIIYPSKHQLLQLWTFIPYVRVFLIPNIGELEHFFGKSSSQILAAYLFWSIVIWTFFSTHLLPCLTNQLRDKNFIFQLFLHAFQINIYLTR